jgi:phosphoribosylformylglycinamidine cyclo-ligase
VSATDGVGTKTAIAAAMRRYDTIGRDLVAMCADDVVCQGARPLFFLDYVAVGRVDPVDVAELVGGVAAGCELAGCALVGGETAEHPGLMRPDEFDWPACVGVGARRAWTAAPRARRRAIGMAASGLHANGYSSRALPPTTTCRSTGPTSTWCRARQAQAARVAAVEPIACWRRWATF